METVPSAPTAPPSAEPSAPLAIVPPLTAVPFVTMSVPVKHVDPQNPAFCKHGQALASPHDCKYVDERNSLLDDAAAEANSAYSKEPKTLSHQWAWNRIFLATVQRLWEKQYGGRK